MSEEEEYSGSGSEGEEEIEQKAPERAVVIDLGSGVFKAGLAGEEYPSCCFQNVVGIDRAVGEKEGYLRLKQFRKKRAERKKFEEEREERLKILKKKELKKKKQEELLKKKLAEKGAGEDESKKKKEEPVQEKKELTEFEKRKLAFMKKPEPETPPEKVPPKTGPGVKLTGTDKDKKDVGKALLVSRLASQWEEKSKGNNNTAMDKKMKEAKKEEDFSRVPDLEYTVGDEAIENRADLTLYYPIEKGNVQDWEALEFIMEDCLLDQLKVEPDERYMLVSENILCSRKNREYLAELLFEEFSVPGVYFAPQPMLCLYGAGRTTGLVIDSGDQVTSTVAVFEGFEIPHTRNISPIGGRQITQYLQRLMMRSGYNFESSAEHQMAREAKEALCVVAEDFEEAQNKPLKQWRKKYELPDGQEIQLDEERFMAPELMFKPMLNGTECLSISELALQTFKQAPIDVRPHLYSNVVLCGGNTLIPGMETRLKKELDTNVGTYKTFKITADPARQFLAWTGGAVMADLNTFEDFVISIDEYEENPWSIHKHHRID